MTDFISDLVFWYGTLIIIRNKKNLKQYNFAKRRYFNIKLTGQNNTMFNVLNQHNSIFLPSHCLINLANVQSYISQTFENAISNTSPQRWHDSVHSPLLSRVGVNMHPTPSAPRGGRGVVTSLSPPTVSFASI